MASAGLLMLLLSLSCSTPAALRAARSEDRVGPSGLSDWKYYPPGAKLGIVTGGTPDLYEKFNYGAKSASLMLAYAKRHGYAFYVDKNMGRLSDLHKGWNKVPLMQKLLREVPVLVWMDADMILEKLDVPFEHLMDTAKCNGADQKKWDEPFLPKKTNNNTFIWMNQDESPARHLVNANAAMIALKQTPEAFAFLAKAWEIGRRDPKHFEHHSDPMRWMRKDPKAQDYGWPYEQGAFWDVMAQEPHIYMRGACIAKGTHFHSVQAHKWSPGNFANHLSGFTDQLKRDQTQMALVRAEVKPEIH